MAEKKKILMIDDDNIIRDLFKFFFKTKKNFEFYTAVDMEEGWQKIIEYKPDCIILDLILPENLSATAESQEPNKEFGFKLLSKLKQAPETKDKPVLIFSNLSDPEDIERCKKFGADEYLAKTGVVPNQVLAKIQKLLGI